MIELKIKLDQLDKAIVVLLWPAERVLVGLRVCKWLRDLLFEKDRLFLSLRGGQRHAFSTLGEDLVRFRHQQLLVELCGTGHSCKTFLYYVASGLEYAQSKGWAGNFGHVKLTSIGRGWAGMYNSTTMSWFGRGMVAGESLYSFLGKCTTLTSLDLSFNDVVQDRKLADLLKRWTGLKTLKLQHTLRSSGVSSLCSVIGQCHNLVTLDLRGNRIMERSLETLASALENCTALEHLDISRNDMHSACAKRVGESLSRCRGLRTLNLRGEFCKTTSMHVLPAALQGLTALTDLDISYNMLGNQGAGAVADLLLQATQLTRLGLVSVNLEAAGVAALGEGLSRCSALQALDLSENDIERGAAALGLAVRACGRLQLLSLRACGLSSESLWALMPHLLSLSSLSELDLGHNPVLAHRDSPRAAALGELLAGLPSLQRLHLRGLCAEAAADQGTTGAAGGQRQEGEAVELRRGACGGAVRPGVEGLSRGLPRCQGLEAVDLEQSGLGDGGAALVVRALAASSGLRALSLADNGVRLGRAAWSREGAGSVLGGCAGLTALDVRRNLLGAEGAAVLAEAVGELASLQRLDVSMAGLGSGGAGAVAGAVGRSRTLTELKCSDNAVGCLGATRVAEAVVQQGRVRVLELGGNEIGDAGGEELWEAIGAGEAVGRGRGVRKLLLARNNIGERVAGQLLAALQQSSVLHRLDLRQCHVSQETLDCIDVLSS